MAKRRVTIEATGGDRWYEFESASDADTLMRELIERGYMALPENSYSTGSNVLDRQTYVPLHRIVSIS
jgi:uncharacterized protein (UPF0248 family)